MADLPDGGADAPGSARDADAVRDHIREHMSTDDSAELAVHAVDELADQAAEIDRLRADVALLNDQLLRRAAEFQNYRRRSESQRADDERSARAGALTPLLDVFDDLRRSLDAARRATRADDGTPPAASPAFDALSQGVELVYRKFEGVFDALGVERIAATGAPFSEAEHEAVLQQPAPGGEAPGTVLAEVQPGYRLGDRVLRHARVIVAA